MSFWDYFTWLMIVTLAASAVSIFALFLRDIGGVLGGQDRSGPDGGERGRSPGPPGS